MHITTPRPPVSDNYGTEMRNESERTVAGYLGKLADDKRPAVERLHGLIRHWQPELEVEIWHSMGFDIIGYGQATYQRPGKPPARWFVVGLAAHKTYFSLYIWGIAEGRYLAELYADRIGGVKNGKSCLNFKDPADLDLVALREVIGLAAEGSSNPKPPRKA